MVFEGEFSREGFRGRVFVGGFSRVSVNRAPLTRAGRRIGQHFRHQHRAVDVDGDDEAAENDRADDGALQAEPVDTAGDGEARQVGVTTEYATKSK